MIEDVDGVLVEAPAEPRLLAHDCYVVATADLSPIVRGFVDDWNRRRPSDGGKLTRGRARRRRATMYGAYAWLAQESGLPVETLKNIARGPSRRRWTPLQEAEAIVVAALERPDLIAPQGAAVSLTAGGALQVVPDPRGCC